MKDEERSDDVSNGKRAGPWFFVGDFTNYPGYVGDYFINHDIRIPSSFTTRII